jgi:hypothetical protein
VRRQSGNAGQDQKNHHGGELPDKHEQRHEQCSDIGQSVGQSIQCSRCEWTPRWGAGRLHSSLSLAAGDRETAFASAANDYFDDCRSCSVRDPGGRCCHGRDDGGAEPRLSVLGPGLQIHLADPVAVVQRGYVVGSASGEGRH